ncbi:MAG: hypothetical protein ABEJ03_00445 [Candidatus Nanohaloarchaea archaeon]
MATVSARVPDGLKEEISEEGIEVSPIIREALEEELKRRRRKQAKEKSEKLPEIGTGEELAEEIRRDRKR